jgi:hypothetical protein
MLASLFGALIGGLFAVIGGWLAIHWQAARQARGVAGALVAEMAVTERLLNHGGAAALYQQMLDDLKATGEIRDRQALVDLFDNEPQDTLPVYYSMAGELGHLPKELAAEVVQYNSTMVALPRMIVRFLGKRELSKQVVKELAQNIEAQFQENRRLRGKLITQLAEFASTPVSLLPERAAARRATED